MLGKLDSHMQKNEIGGNSLAVQWLGLRASTARGSGSIPGWETKIPQAAQCSQKKKKRNWTTILHHTQKSTQNGLKAQMEDLKP